MKKRFAFILMMLLLMTQGARADLYFESGGIYYRGELLFNVVIVGYNGLPIMGLKPELESANVCAPPAPYKYEGVITLHRTTSFPGADFEHEDEQYHLDPIPSIKVGCDKGAFENSPNLIKVIFPEPQDGNVFGSSGVSFKGCSSLQAVENMDLSSVEAHQFDGCSSLTDIDLSETNQINEYAFVGCSSLKDMVIRKSRILGYAFSGCSNLETISFEETNVIYDGAFSDCNNIKKVISKDEDPTIIEDNAFTQTVYKNALLVVPKGTVETYKATKGWKNFYNIVEEGSEPSIDPTPSPGPEPSTDSQPYAVYNNNTLTFYCDNQRSSREGTTYDLRSELRERALPPKWFRLKGPITKAFFDASFANARPTTTYAWFNLGESLMEIQDIINLNTSEVTIMSAMFGGCSSLTSLDVSNFNTSNVTAMDGLFSGCSSLTSLDVSNFNTSNVTSMGQMFNGCSSLTSLDLSKFNTSNVSFMYRLFYGCSSLTTIIMGSHFTSNESTEVKEAFYGCTKLRKVTFTGDIPASINSKFFEGVGTADAPAILDVPEQYKANYAAKFDGNKFYGGYFQLSGDDQKSSPLEMTFKVLNAVDGIVYYSKPSIKLTVKNNSENEFKGKGWYSCSQQLDNGEWFDKYRGGEYDIPLPPGEKWWASSSFVGFEDGFYKWEWGYEEENGNKVNLGSTIIEVRGHDRYRAIWMDSDIDNGTWKTFCDEDNLDFSHTEGLNVYIATDFNVTASEVQMQQVGDAVAGTGLLLIGETGCYLAERTVSASTYSSNMLVGVLGNTKYVKANEDGYANYIYRGKDKNNKQKFNIASDKGSIVYENEAYLRVPTQTAGDTQSITPVFGESTVGEEPYVVYNDYTLTFYSDDQRSSRTGVTYSLNEGENEPEWVLDDNNRNVEKVVFDSSFSKARPTSTFQWFFYCDFLTEIKGIENLNTSEVRNMRAMFFSCSRLKSIDVSHFDTKAVEDMGGMFSNCTNLESINVSHFNTSNVYNMTSMFNECQSLTDLDLSNFNTSKAEYLPYMFSGCSNLRTLYLGSGFTSSNDVSCEEAFSECQSLSKVVFTGDIPASINSEFFKGVGTADAPVKLDVPEQFEANFAANFNGNMFYGGYFILRETIVPNAEDGGKDYSSGNSEIDETTDLNGTIIGNVYYSIAPEDGGYNSAEGCLVVTKPSPDADFDYEDPFDEEFKNIFTGIVIMVQPGSGTVKIEAETSEGMSLMVKIGNNLPVKMTLQTKSTLAIPYTVTRPTYVYIYAGGDNSTREASDGALKIYGFSWESSSTGINAPIATDDQPVDVYSLSGTMVKKGTRSLESLPKGVYIVNGRKFVKK